jgi:hypothetical protein
LRARFRVNFRDGTSCPTNRLEGITLLLARFDY